MEIKTEDQEVTKIACSVAEAREEDIPGLLIQLTGILEKHSENAEHLQLFKKSVWKYDLLSYCVVALKFDYAKIPQGFAGAVSIVKLICECSCSMKIDNSQEFFKDTLPHTIPSILHLVRVFQRRLADLPKKHSHLIKTEEILAEELFGYLKSFITVYPHLCAFLLNSNDLLRIILEDDKFSSTAIKLVHTTMLVNRYCLPQVSRGNLCALLDELVNILTTAEDEAIARTTTRLLLSMCDSYDQIAVIMIGRFKGLKAVLNRWKEHGFTRSLQRLIETLESGDAKKALDAKKKHAVDTIWAFYIGWKTRQRMRIFQRNIPALQRSFRSKFREKRETQELEKSVRFQETEINRQKQRSFRQTREKQLQSIEIVPAKKVSEFIQNEEHRAATKIQSHWRAFSYRKTYNAKLEFQRATVAAICIQKAVRKFLSKKNRHSISGDKAIEEMGLEQKSKYQEEIKSWQILHQQNGVNREDVEHNQTEMQKLLLDFYRTKTISLNTEHKTNALLARIHTEEETLNHLPSISETGRESIERLACKSAVIQRAAVMEHNKEEKQHTYPWWKRLAVEDDELAREGW